MNYKIKISFIAFLFVLPLGACSLGHRLNLRRDLANQGPLAVVPGNSFIAANIFLDDEMKHSQMLRSFIAKSGKPEILEVHKGAETNLSLIFYYLKEKQQFVLLESGDDWIISVASPIPPERIAELQRYVSLGLSSRFGMDDAEVVHVGTSASEKTEAKKSEVPDTEKSAAKSDPNSLRPQKEFNPIPFLRRHNAKTPPESTTQDGSAKPAAPTTAAAKIVRPKKDITHRVTNPSETLDAIVTWYTGDSSNVGAVARMNGVPETGALQPGTEIRLPSYMLKRADPLPIGAPAPVQR